ncbi:MAG: leucine-rich repeat domain-containing protein [Candidatus Paceibacterota bacterium]
MNINKYLLVALLIIIAIFVYCSPSLIKNVINTNLSVSNDTNAIKLDLSNKGLTKVPEYVFSMKQLEELNLSNNQLTGAIPSQIGQLKNLKILNLSHNLMTGLPAELGQLSQLTELDVSYNSLTGLPNELGNLKNLKTFNLIGNNYSTLDLDGIINKLPSLQVIK